MPALGPDALAFAPSIPNDAVLDILSIKEEESDEPTTLNPGLDSSVVVAVPEISESEAPKDGQSKPDNPWKGKSMYPVLLEGAQSTQTYRTQVHQLKSTLLLYPLTIELITTVLDYEPFLFTETERAHLQHLRSLSCTRSIVPLHLFCVT